MPSRIGLLVLATLTALACAEATSPVTRSPAPKPINATVSYSDDGIPIVDDVAEAIATFGAPEIYKAASYISVGTEGHGWIGGYMQYKGNHAEQTLTFTATSSNSGAPFSASVTENDVEYSRWDPVAPGTFDFRIGDKPFLLPDKCGYVMDIFGQHTARMDLLIRVSWLFTTLETTKASSNTARQEPCPPKNCDPTVTSERDDPSGPYYDPNSDSNCGSTGNGGSIGSGIQFAPGDYTNGETVDFTTGIGNGGTSVCGKAAQVIEVCVDQYDDSGRLIATKCGYATSC